MSHKWWVKVQDRLMKTDHSQAQEALKTAVQWYCNEEVAFTKETGAHKWDGLVVQANMFQRDIDILRSVLYADVPKPSIKANMRDMEALKATEAFKALLLKVWEETLVHREINMCILMALYGNLGYMRLEFDMHRQIPVMKWMTGEVIYDENSAGIPARALWAAEIFSVSLIEIYTNEAFPKDRREELLTAVKGRIKEGEKFDLEMQIKIAYVWSKRGEKPWEKLEGRKLVVVCEELEEPLLVSDWDWPFIDHDRFPIYRLMFNKIPKDDYGITMFAKLRAPVNQYNWAASFAMESARKTASAKLFYDKSRLADPSRLTSGKHMETCETNGPPAEAVHYQELGSSNRVALDSFMMSKQIHDEQSGINEVARGDSLGDRTTAEEVRTRSRGSSTVFKGYSDAIDDFLSEVTRDHVSALVYFVPRWDRIALGGQIVESAFDGMQWLQNPIPPEEAANLLSPVALPDFYVVRPGVNAWVGVNHALNWLDYDIEQLKRDFSFTVRVGSTHTDYSNAKKQDTLILWQTLIPFYQTIGPMAGEAMYELTRAFVEANADEDPMRFLPPREAFTAMQSFVSEPAGTEQQGAGPTPAEQPPEHSLGMQTDRPFGASDAEGLTNEPDQMDPGAMA